MDVVQLLPDLYGYIVKITLENDMRDLVRLMLTCKMLYKYVFDMYPSILRGQLESDIDGGMRDFIEVIQGILNEYICAKADDDGWTINVFHPLIDLQIEVRVDMYIEYGVCFGSDDIQVNTCQLGDKYKSIQLKVSIGITTVTLFTCDSDTFVINNEVNDSTSDDDIDVPGGVVLCYDRTIKILNVLKRILPELKVNT